MLNEWRQLYLRCAFEFCHLEVADYSWEKMSDREWQKEGSERIRWDPDRYIYRPYLFIPLVHGDMCWTCVCFSGQSTINKMERKNRAWPAPTNSSSAVRANRLKSSFGVCSAPGVLDPLVSSLSDLQVVLSHLIMVQAPWIFKEWLSDTCQTSLTRLMESTMVSAWLMNGWDSAAVAVKTFLMHHVVLANRM